MSGKLKKIIIVLIIAIIGIGVTWGILCVKSRIKVQKQLDEAQRYWEEVVRQEENANIIENTINSQDTLKTTEYIVDNNIENIDEILDVEEYNKSVERENQLLNILYKYYNKEEIDELVENVNKFAIEDGQYIVSEYAEKLIYNIINILENENVDNYEKDFVREVLNDLDYTELKNDELRKKLSELKIDV